MLTGIIKRLFADAQAKDVFYTFVLCGSVEKPLPAARDVTSEGSGVKAAYCRSTILWVVLKKWSNSSFQLWVSREEAKNSARMLDTDNNALKIGEVSGFDKPSFVKGESK